MDDSTRNIETLLGRLIEIGEDISTKMDSLDDRLSDIQEALNQDSEVTFANDLFKQLSDMAEALSDIKSDLSEININTASLS